jgi:hypothetical protein
MTLPFLLWVRRVRRRRPRFRSRLLDAPQLGMIKSLESGAFDDAAAASAEAALKASHPCHTAQSVFVNPKTKQAPTYDFDLRAGVQWNTTSGWNRRIRRSICPYRGTHNNTRREHAGIRHMTLPCLKHKCVRCVVMREYLSLSY